VLLKSTSPKSSTITAVAMLRSKSRAHRGNRPVTGAAEELAAPAAASGAVAGISRLIPNPINDPRMTADAQIKKGR